jgi:hypothetical protein
MQMKAAVIDNQEFRITGKAIRMMSLRNDYLDEIRDPELVINACREQKIPADILTFSQHIPDTHPKYAYHMEWETIAVIPITSYEEWFKRQIDHDTRKAINKAQKSGVKVIVQKFDGEVVRGLVGIFNETPIRQGRLYPFYGLGADAVAKIWSSDLHRCDFIVAYVGNEIAGFIKLLYAKERALMTGTLAKLVHRDKAVMNALIAKSVEVCAAKAVPYLLYGKYNYGNKNEDDGLTVFKRHNGCQKIDEPRYYMPLSPRGWVGYKLGLHRGLSGILHPKAIQLLNSIRSSWYSRRYGQKQ